MKRFITITTILMLILTLIVPSSVIAKDELMTFPGFVTSDDQLRYYESQEDFDSNNPVKGQVVIDGYTYYFSTEDGHALSGWVGKAYYDKDFHMVKGWKTIEGKTYYFNKKTGNKTTGLVKIGSGKSALVCTFTKKGVLSRKLYASKKSICLTFDDGPSSSTTRVLNTLANYGAKATFFMVGNRCKSYKNTCKKVSQAGHQVACHTYSHAWLKDLSASGVSSQMKKGKNSIKKYTGVSPIVCRTPGGQNTKTIRNNVGMPIILWSVDTMDWSHRNPSITLRKVKEGAKNGAIVLMHDLYSTTADAVPKICKYLKGKGYQMVTINEMALLKGKKLKAGKVYFSL